MQKVVAVSGGFDPVHVGHLRMFQEAKKLGTKLIVILNGDQWLKRKKGYCFMPQEQRKELIEAIACVDEVRICDSADRDDIAWALEEIKPDIFANGGDRKNDTTPEVAACEEMGVKMVFGVGGEKAESSSTLADRAWLQKHRSERPWGDYVLYEQGKGWALKTLHLKPGECTSLQTHKGRDEFWMLVEGSATLKDGDPLHPFCYYRISRGNRHRLTAGKEGCTVVEVMYGVYDENDIIRHEDNYGRV